MIIEIESVIKWIIMIIFILFYDDIDSKFISSSLIFCVKTTTHMTATMVPAMRAERTDTPVVLAQPGSCMLKIGYKQYEKVRGAMSPRIIYPLNTPMLMWIHHITDYKVKDGSRLF